MLQATESLALAEHSADKSSLQTVAKNLHQIQASLQMVELDAAGMLARDLETLTGQLSEFSDRSVDDPSNSISVLKNGLESLKKYLAAIENQIPQSPLVLVDDINAVRAITADKKITSYDLFDPPLEFSAYISDTNTLRLPADKRRNILLDLRKRFRQALLAWLGNHNRDQSLTAMAEIIGHFQKASGLDILQQLWWVAAGFVESVQAGKIKEGADIKAQFAKLDHEMSRMSDNDWGSIASAPPDELLRQMLFYIGDAVVDRSDANHPVDEISQRVSQINEQLGLQQWFAFATDVQQQDEFARLARVITEFAAACDTVNPERLENHIDSYFAGGLEAGQVENFFALLDKLKATSEQYNMEDLNDFINALVESIKSVDPGSGVLSQTGADIKIASALLLLKDSLATPSMLSPQWRQAIAERTSELTRLLESEHSDQRVDVSSGHQADAEFAQAKAAVIDEINARLSTIETVISTISHSDFDPQNLARVSEHLYQIAGWFEILGGGQTAILVRSAAQKFTQSLIDAENQESIAFVIAAVGVCAEQLAQAEADNQSGEIIERARKMLDTLVVQQAAPAFQTETRQGKDQPGHENKSENAIGIEPVEPAPPVIDVHSSNDDLIAGLVDSDSPDDMKSVASQLENLDAIRRDILNASDREVDSIRLALIFSRLEDSADIHQSKGTSDLASIGRQLTQKIINGEIAFDAEVADFIGLISRQMRRLESSQQEDSEWSPAGWEEKLISIISRKEIKDEQHLEAEAALDPLVHQPDAIQESAPFDNPMLRKVFVDDLNQYSVMLKDACLAIYDDAESSDSVGSQDQIRRASLEQVTRVIHTLTGNFNSLGLASIGACFERMETAIQLDTDDAVIRHRHCLELRALYLLLADTAVEIQQHPETFQNDTDRQRPYSVTWPAARVQGISQSTAERYWVIADRLDALQREMAETAAAHMGTGEPEQLDEFQQGAPPEPDQAADFDALELDQAADSTAELTPPDDDSAELKQIFLEESESRLNTINGLLTEWRLNDVNEAVLGGIRREFHTLKGSAAATGFDEISRLSHAVESLLEQGDNRSLSDHAGLLNLLEEVHDGLAAELGFIPGVGADHVQSLISMVELLLGGDSKPLEEDENRQSQLSIAAADDRSALVQQQAASREPVAGHESDHEHEEPGKQQAPQESATDREPEVAQKPALIQTAPSHTEQTKPWKPPVDFAPGRMGSEARDFAEGSLRIENRRLTDLLNYSGELGLTRTQVKNILDSTRAELDTLRSSMEMIRDGLRDMEFEADAQMRSLPETSEQTLGDEAFDPLQLDRYSRLQTKAREVSHQLDSLVKVERRLSAHASDLGGALTQQRYLGEQLQDGLMSARMISVNDYMPRLRQLVRDSSRKLGKSAEFSVEGGDIEVDRQVMDMMMPPFEHMVRNAIVHGIETDTLRLEKDKPPTGQIRLHVVQQGSELLINFSDDGQGLDQKKLSQRALETGLINSVEESNEEHFLQIISQPGFSTADTVSMASGRGVGMDIVYQVVRSLGGSMALSSVPGEGTDFQFRLPVTLVVSQALLVKVGTFRFAIITRTIERVMRVRESEWEMIDGKRHVVVDDQHIPVFNLAELLGEVSLNTEESFRSLVLLRLADRIAGFEVDQLQETVEVVTKTPGSQLTSIEGVIGVTILADTSIVLIIEPDQLIHKAVLQSQGLPAYVYSEQDDKPIAGVDVSTILQRVLVVDDSLVVRKVMQRDIAGFDLEAVLAVDGIDALEKLQETAVDFALIDLEMPRMNGYELIIKLRQDHRFENLPIIVITSRSGEMHRDRAIGLGADGYITKPYDNKELKKMMELISLRKTVKH